MTTRKNQNSILFLTTLGVCLGIFFSGLVAQSVFAQADIQINKRPLKDFSLRVKQGIETKKVDLTSPFLVELKGKLDANGKIDPATAKYIRAEGDSAVVGIVKNGIEAINDSGYLQYLKSLSADELTILVSQNASEFTTEIFFLVPSANRAASIRSQLQLLLAMSAMQKKQKELSEADKRDLVLLEAVKVASNDKEVTVSFNIPSDEIRKMVMEELGKQAKIEQ